MECSGCETVRKKEFTVELDFEACKECGYCLDVCENDVFSPGSKFNAKGYRSMEVKNPENCIGCMKCFYNCPDFCIEIKGED
jgi:NAD-dependent dihydropyrimidine dehydrogenase PreA subunit